MRVALSVDELVGRDEWDAVNRSLRRPFVVYKFAATLDGRIAAEDGTSQWITSAESRAEVHLLRAGCDATVVGSGTQQADDPSLAVRGDALPDRQPLRVVIDSNARTPRDAKVCDDTAPTLVVVAEDADASHLAGVADVLKVRRAERGLDLPAVLAGLHARGVRALFLEGGPTLAGGFIAHGFVDRVVNYVAPALLGSGKSGLGDAGVRSMSGILRLELVDVSRSGADVRLVSRPVRG
ncbi:RibD family protein [Actinosynnema sp. NPDC050801]|uniref:RibD family protein n=1 Tax=unclassified Actinosynnema TaxID=2637065 RepID=UPI0033DA24D7